METPSAHPQRSRAFEKYCIWAFSACGVSNATGKRASCTAVNHFKVVPSKKSEQELRSIRSVSFAAITWSHTKVIVAFTEANVLSKRKEKATRERFFGIKNEEKETRRMKPPNKLLQKPTFSPNEKRRKPHENMKPNKRCEAFQDFKSCLEWYAFISVVS